MENILNYINGELSAEEKLQFEKKLAEDGQFRKVYEEELALWKMMESIELPAVDTTKAKARFFNTLDVYKEASTNVPQVSFLQKLKELWSFQPQLKLSYALALLVVGLGIGLIFSNKSKLSGDQEIAKLTSEVSEMKQVMMLSLIENPSATERIRAVSMTSEIKNVDDQVIDALLSTLNNDANDNVRLMTLEALIELADHPKVREGLVKSIVKQTSPLMQTAMADAMLKLQEKDSIKPLKKILKQKNLNSTVRDKVEDTIQKILI
jgi:anti-sigma-K factor RskA